MAAAANDDEDIPYVDDIVDEAAPTDSQLGSIATLAQRAHELKDIIAERTAALQQLLVEYRQILDRDLPDAMSAAGQQQCTITGVGKVTAREKFVGTKLTDPVGLDWVENNGGASLIKTTIMVELPAAELETARRLVHLLRSQPEANRFERLDFGQNVHHSTIGAFAAELTKKGRAPPLDLLGVTRRVSVNLGGSRYTDVKLTGLIRND